MRQLLLDDLCCIIFPSKFLCHLNCLNIYSFSTIPLCSFYSFPYYLSLFFSALYLAISLCFFYFLPHYLSLFFLLFPPLSLFVFSTLYLAISLCFFYFLPYYLYLFFLLCTLLSLFVFLLFTLVSLFFYKLPPL